MSTKRITVSVNQDVDVIRARLASDTGIKMSYIQVFNYLNVPTATRACAAWYRGNHAQVVVLDRDYLSSLS